MMICNAMQREGLRLAPSLCREKISRIVWMGGATSVGGNATAWAEANACYDPEAAHIVLTSGIQLMMYTWDVYLKVEHTKEEVLSAAVKADKGGGVHTPHRGPRSPPGCFAETWHTLVQKLRK